MISWRSVSDQPVTDEEAADLGKKSFMMICKVKIWKSELYSAEKSSKADKLLGKLILVWKE